MKKCLFIMLFINIFFFSFMLNDVSAKTSHRVPLSFQKNVKKQLVTTVPIILPTKVAIADKLFINAKTEATKNSYKVVYYALPKQFSVNAPSVKKANIEQVAVRITGKKFASKKLAKQQIAKELIFPTSKVKIQKDLIGYVDAGAGSTWLSWKVGHWTLVSQNKTYNTTKNIQFARQTMKYLQRYKLPLIKQQGIIYLGENAQNYRVKWQQDKIIYEVTLLKNSREILQLVTSLEK